MIVIRSGIRKDETPEEFMLAFKGSKGNMTGIHIAHLTEDELVELHTRGARFSQDIYFFLIDTSFLLPSDLKTDQNLCLRLFNETFIPTNRIWLKQSTSASLRFLMNWKEPRSLNIMHKILEMGLIPHNYWVNEIEAIIPEYGARYENGEPSGDGMQEIIDLATLWLKGPEAAAKVITTEHEWHFLDDDVFGKDLHFFSHLIPNDVQKGVTGKVR